MKRKDLWLFLAKLVPLTLALGYLWFSGLQVRYPYLIDPIATPFLEALGVRQWMLALVLEHFTNILPYVALVLASPGLIARWPRSLAALLGGLAIIVLGHLLLSWVVYELYIRYSLSKAFYRIIVPVYLVNDALPLVLWLIFFPGVPARLFGLRIFGHKADREEPTKG